VVHQVFRVKNGGSYSVHGDLLSGVTVFKNGDKTVNQDLPGEEVDITQLSAPTLDPSDISSIQATFGRLGANVGFNPVTVPSALGSIFGGLVWYVEGQDSPTSETQLVALVSPDQLTGAVKLSDFQYPAGPVITKDSTISTDSSVKAAANIPLWGSLAANFTANNVYKVHWSMTGFGNVTKNDGTVSFVDRINSLSQAQKADICSRLKTDKSHVMYVNEMYVVKSVALNYQQGTAISSGASITGGSIIAGNAAYDFSSSATQEEAVDDTVVNIQGPIFSAGTMAICATPGAATPAQPVNAVGTLGHVGALSLGDNFVRGETQTPTLERSAIKRTTR
jgi:hypothetical protein